MWSNDPKTKASIFKVHPCRLKALRLVRVELTSLKITYWHVGQNLKGKAVQYVHLTLRLLSLKLALYFLSEKIILFNFLFQYVFVNLYTSSVNAEIYTVWSETCNSSI